MAVLPALLVCLNLPGLAVFLICALDAALGDLAGVPLMGNECLTGSPIFDMLETSNDRLFAQLFPDFASVKPPLIKRLSGMH